jgi:hypothetical protein
MSKSFPIFLLLAGSAFGQGNGPNHLGSNYLGSIKGKLFRDLSSNPRGLFEHRPNQNFRILFATKESALNDTRPTCAIRLLEVPAKVVAPGMILRQSGGDSGDTGIFVSTLPTCPPPKQ